MRTLGDDTARETSGFDYLRLIFACTVVLWHSVAITNPVPAGQPNNELANAASWNTYRAAFDAMVPGFFIISGFLVGGSLIRNRLSAFLMLRLVRVLPALSVSVAFGALMVGPIVTALPLNSYLGDSLLWKYFLNAVGLNQPRLPGVFENNPLAGTVNGSLWTIYYELMSYLLLAWLAVLGLHRRPRLFLALAVGVYACVLVLERQLTNRPHNGYDGYLLFACFLSGAALYFNRNAIPSSPVIAVCAGVLAVALLSSQRLDLFGAWPLAYGVVWLGLRDLPKTALIETGDYSYGIYLFSHPVGQALWWAGAGRTFPSNLALTLVLSFAAALLSWRFIEHPALRRKAWAAEWATRSADSVRKRWFAGSPIVDLKATDTIGKTAE